MTKDFSCGLSHDGDGEATACSLRRAEFGQIVGKDVVEGVDDQATDMARN
ncbi:hypothetical protein [Cypionkella sp.]|nr:hypothetical protein [Cypionkella sp.]